MEGNMRGPSSLDCEKSFARTGLLSANMILKTRAADLKSGGPRYSLARAKPTLVQIAGLRQPQASPLRGIIDPVHSAPPCEESFTRL
jgi:hypothetical protein